MHSQGSVAAERHWVDVGVASAGTPVCRPRKPGWGVGHVLAWDVIGDVPIHAAFGVLAKRRSLWLSMRFLLDAPVSLAVSTTPTTHGRVVER